MEGATEQQISELRTRYDRTAIIIVLIAMFIGAVGIVLYSVGQALTPINIPMIITGYTFLGVTALVTIIFSVDIAAYYIRRRICGLGVDHV